MPQLKIAFVLKKKFKTFMLKLFPKIYFELLIAPKFSE